MGYRAGVGFSIAVIAFLAAPACSAGDLEDVQAVWEQQVKSYNTRNVDTFLPTVHDQAVGFGPVAPFAIESNAQRQQGLGQFFGSLEMLSVTPMDFQFRVFGNTAVGWGYFAMALKPKDGPMIVPFGRMTITYSKMGDKWVAVSSHASSIPSGE
jgi:ketosteroid isomerase-like protein